MNEQAKKTYQETENKIHTEIEILQTRLADLHAQAKAMNTLNWAHVGDLQYILSMLQQLNGDEEDV